VIALFDHLIRIVGFMVVCVGGLGAFVWLFVKLAEFLVRQAGAWHALFDFIWYRKQFKEWFASRKAAHKEGVES
jgi:hypothetical protein